MGAPKKRQCTLWASSSETSSVYQSKLEQTFSILSPKSIVMNASPTNEKDATIAAEIPEEKPPSIPDTTSTLASDDTKEKNIPRRSIYYKELCDVLEFVKNNTKRIDITDKLAEFFARIMREAPEDLTPCVYLCIGCIAPAYEGKELGIGEAMLMKAISVSTGRPVKSLKEDLDRLGDIGSVAQISRSTQKTIFKEESLRVKDLFKILNEIAACEGSSSQIKKIGLMNRLFSSCSPIESQFLARFLEKKMRIGLAEKTVLRSLAQATVLAQSSNSEKSEIHDKILEAVDAIMCAYSYTPNFGIITNALVTGGIKHLALECTATPGIPLRPMLAHPARSIAEIVSRFESSEVLCEFKYDGERVQIHNDGSGSVKIFSRNMENLSEKYPDVIDVSLKIPKSGVSSFIIDCEAVAWDKENKKSLPFQALSTRRRRDVSLSSVDVSVCIFAFDILYLNGKPTIDLLHDERRNMLISNFETIDNAFSLAEGIKTSSIDEMDAFFKKSTQSNCEGLIIKCLNDTSTYKPTIRTRNWIKLKKDYLETTGDTFDLVPIAAYAGRGKRTNFFGGYLLAIYSSEKETYQSVCKIGTGFSEKYLQDLQDELSKYKIDRPRPYYEWEDSPNMRPDIWFDAVQVWEVKAADISLSPVHKAGIGLIDKSKGISLRFPRFIRVRPDKDPTDSTTGEQLAQMYCRQLNRDETLEPLATEEDYV